jgi:hypothetical protein
MERPAVLVDFLMQRDLCRARCLDSNDLGTLQDGISHSEIEDARPEHLGAGGNVLPHAVLARGRIACCSLLSWASIS